MTTPAETGPLSLSADLLDLPFPRELAAPPPPVDVAPQIFGATEELLVPAPAQPSAPAAPATVRTDSWLAAGSHRALDLLVAGTLLLLLAPVMIVVALCIAASGPGPVIFRQERIGRDGRRFTCLKFRTMAVGAERALDNLFGASPAAREEWARDQKIRSDPRVTTIGRLLRKYSIDEIPQLMNVLLGDMSIVGPRPIVAAEVPRYADHFAEYCSVRPGLTGLWQVSGRNDVSYALRVELDCEYARSKSLALDLMIMLRTIPVVLAGRGY